MHRSLVVAACLTAAISLSAAAADFDVIIKNGTVYDGTGGEGRRTLIWPFAAIASSELVISRRPAQKPLSMRAASPSRRVHQHALVVDGIVDRGWALAK